MLQTCWLGLAVGLFTYDLSVDIKEGIGLREIDASEITAAIRQAAIDVNYHLPEDVETALCSAQKAETNDLARDILGKTIQNAEIAKKGEFPICQDTGMAVIFVEIGQEVYIKGSLEAAIQEGVRQGYKDGYLRKSILKDPLDRINTDDNTPAVIHYEIVPGDVFRFTFLAKGFGSENMSRLKMLKPSDGMDGVMDFVVETVKLAASNPCPPVIVGVGIGGDFEKAAILSKKALLRELGSNNSDTFYAEMENKLLERINRLGIGPQGFGGDTTALGVHILSYPTHIAALPVAVNISCYVSRHKSVSL